MHSCASWSETKKSCMVSIFFYLCLLFQVPAARDQRLFCCFSCRGSLLQILQVQVMPTAHTPHSTMTGLSCFKYKITFSTGENIYWEKRVPAWLNSVLCKVWMCLSQFRFQTAPRSGQSRCMNATIPNNGEWGSREQGDNLFLIQILALFRSFLRALSTTLKSCLLSP